MSVQINPIAEQMTERLELPKDVVLGIPCISMLGSREFYIDNHMGILSFESGQVVIRTKHEPIRIAGQNLLIEYYTRDSIKLTGQITEICFLL